MNKKLLSVIVPMYNEEAVVNECYKRLKEVMRNIDMNHELIFINDGSRDNTISILKKLANTDKSVRILDFARNFGHQTAVTAGVFNSSGDAVVVIDADLQDPPELIMDMLDKWKKGYDVVYAKRAKRNGETWFKLVTAKYFYKFLSKMSEVDIPTDTGDFRLMDKKVVEAFKKMPEKNRFVRGMISWIGFNQTYIEYIRDERFAGETKYPLKKMLKFACDGIIAFSSKPLKFICLLGFFSIFISIILFLYYIICLIFNTNFVSGWGFLIAVLVLFGGIQLLSLGVIGEYISRICDESRNRPLFILKDKINFLEGESNE